MNYLDEAGLNLDGTYTIPDGAEGFWMLRDTGNGWAATHPCDAFNDFDGGPDHLWALAEDAAHAVLGDPATAVRA